MKRLIRGGRLIDPGQQLDSDSDLLIEDGKIAAIAPGLEVSADVPIVEADGLVVTPGLIDLRASCGEPGHEYRESLRSGLRAAAAGGFTAIGLLPETEPVNDQRAVTEMILAEATRHPFARALPIAAVSRGLGGEELAEFGELRDAGAVAFSDGAKALNNAALLRRALLYARHHDAVILHQPSDPKLDSSGMMHEGPWATRLGLPGLTPLSEETVLARDLLLAAETGGRYHVAALSTAAGVEQIRRAKSTGVHVTADVTIHHLLLDDEAVALSGFDSAMKFKPPLRSASDREALVGGLLDGTIDAITSDHRPFHPDEKDVQFSVAPWGAVGLETLLGLCLDRLVAGGRLSLSRLVQLLHTGPASIFSGSFSASATSGLAVGAIADLTLIDLEKQWTIDPDAFESLGRSTPFAGQELRGAAAGTLLAGQPVKL